MIEKLAMRSATLALEMINFTAFHAMKHYTDSMNVVLDDQRHEEMVSS